MSLHTPKPSNGIDPGTTHSVAAHQQALRRWAAVQLQLDDDVSPASAHARFVERLPEADFVPPFAWHQAVEVLTGQVVRDAGNVSIVREVELRARVEQFAAAFFKMDVANRSTRWDELHVQCAEFPALAARVQALKPGLSIDPASLRSENPFVPQLAEVLYELFVLRPVERATRRLQTLNRFQCELSAWSAAAVRLRKSDPAIAALDPDLIDRLLSWARQQRTLARNRRKGRRKSVPAQEAGETGMGWPYRLLWLTFALCFFVYFLRGVMDSDHVRKSPRTPPPSAAPFPRFNSPEDEAAWKRQLHETLEKSIKKPFSPPFPPGNDHDAPRLPATFRSGRP